MNTNEHYINRIIKSYEDDPVKWMYVWHSLPKDSCSFYDICTAYYRVSVNKTDEIRRREGIHTTESTGMAIQAAILCLLTYEDCGYMLDSDPDELRLLAKSGDDKALLLYPACKILKEIE